MSCLCVSVYRFWLNRTANDGTTKRRNHWKNIKKTISAMRRSCLVSILRVDHKEDKKNSIIHARGRLVNIQILLNLFRVSFLFLGFFISAMWGDSVCFFFLFEAILVFKYLVAFTQYSILRTSYYYCRLLLLIHILFVLDIFLLSIPRTQTHFFRCLTKFDVSWCIFLIFFVSFVSFDIASTFFLMSLFVPYSIYIV